MSRPHNWSHIDEARPGISTFSWRSTPAARVHGMTSGSQPAGNGHPLSLLPSPETKAGSSGERKAQSSSHPLPSQRKGRERNLLRIHSTTERLVPIRI